MTKKVLKFKSENGSSYRCGQIVSFCRREALDYLDVDNNFDLHVSSVKPKNVDDVYVLSRYSEPGEIWVFASVDGQEEIGGDSPWPSALDDWFDKHFAGKNLIYAWAEAEE